MRYWKAELGNGFCGCDEQIVIMTEENSYDPVDNFMEFLEGYYSYFEGAAGITLGTDEEVEAGEAEITDEEYIQDIFDNSYVEEITKEEYDELIEEGWEEG